ncbi:hypothetical protein C0992_004315 [Termitomyces sp. T32_za158]|nr:hypothetical protein C0992_004315 [Termitomyces sp. T32_za158]
MPDAPGLDGVLIDTIGYFPQMIIAAGSAIFIFFTFIVKTVDESRNPVSLPQTQSPSAAFNRVRPPPIPTQKSTTEQIAQYEKDRIKRHMNGEYVFPPPRVEVRTHVPSELIAIRLVRLIEQ